MLDYHPTTLLFPQTYGIFDRPGGSGFQAGNDPVTLTSGDVSLLGAWRRLPSLHTASCFSSAGVAVELCAAEKRDDDTTPGQGDPPAQHADSTDSAWTNTVAGSNHASCWAVPIDGSVLSGVDPQPGEARTA